MIHSNGVYLGVKPESYEFNGCVFTFSPNESFEQSGDSSFVFWRIAQEFKIIFQELSNVVDTKQEIKYPLSD